MNARLFLLGGGRARRGAGADAVAFALAFGTAYWLKSTCVGAESLRFLLVPTARLVELASGHSFVDERGFGPFSRELGVVIAPSCAGLNFLVAVFLTLVLAFSARLARPADKAALWLSALAVAYAVTLLVNATRITLWLAVRERLPEAVSAEAAHRAAGVGTYLVALLATHASAARTLAGRALESNGSAGGELMLPLGVYLGLTLLVPLLRGEAARDAYWVHASSVVALSAAIALLVWQAKKLLTPRPRR